ncbi:MAG: MXAN_5187 family protein [Myxococcales bacterium]
MSRIKLLVMAVLIAGAGAFYLSSGAASHADRVRAQAEGELKAAGAALAPALGKAADLQLGIAKALAADAEIGQAFDDANKPTSTALEVAVSALGKLPGEAPKPDLLVLISGGAAARYRVGASNRFDEKDVAFKVVGPVGAAHALTATLDGELFQLAAAPLATTGDPPPPAVGQVVLGWALDEAWARRLGAQAGPSVGVTLLANKKVVASSLPPAQKKALPTALRPGTPVDYGALEGERFALLPGLPVRLPLGAAGAAANRALAFSLGGDAEAVLSVRVASGYADLAADQRQLIFGLAGLVFLCVLLSLIGANPTKGLAGVAAAADKIAQGDLSLRVPTENLAPGVRRLAVALNAIAAGAGTRSPSMPPPKPAAEPSVDELLKAPAPPETEEPSEPKPLSTQPAFELPSSLLSPPPPPTKTTPYGVPPAPMKAVAEPKPPARSRGEDDFGGIFDSQPPPTAAKTVPPPSPSAAPERVPSPFLPDDSDSFNPDATVVAQVPQALLHATRAAAAPPPRQEFPTAVPLPPPAASAEEGHFQAVFREFVATREKCGEPADGLTYDKFVGKLKKNKDQLVAKYNCKSVRFQVYVKEGKAALKATPVRE